MKPIAPGRLEAVPETRLCAEHARQIEKLGGEFIRTMVQERTSKAGSLKRSYGSASIHKTRNYEAMEKLKAEYHSESRKE
ncbi:MAG TPA: hypothetical protein VMS17_15665 [Gemmataceae bacterium]|nr:hypothetical protein [Gemmataceae bacterium]